MCAVYRLDLPGRIVEDGREKGTFDIDKGRSRRLLYDDKTCDGGKAAWLVI